MLLLIATAVVWFILVLTDKSATRVYIASAIWILFGLVALSNESVPEWCDSTASTVYEDCGQMQ